MRHASFPVGSPIAMGLIPTGHNARAWIGRVEFGTQTPFLGIGDGLEIVGDSFRYAGGSVVIDCPAGNSTQSLDSVACPAYIDREASHTCLKFAVPSSRVLYYYVSSIKPLVTSRTPSHGVQWLG